MDKLHLAIFKGDGGVGILPSMLSFLSWFSVISVCKIMPRYG